jgi:hypothetical protein
MAGTGTKSSRSPKQKRSSGKEGTKSPVATIEPVTSRIPSFRGGHLPAQEDVDRLRSLSHPHVDSFNYFLERGLDQGIKDIEPAEICVVDPQKQRDSPSSIDWNETTTIKFWIENVKVAKPVKPSTSGRSNQLMPRECRERGLMYSGPMSGTFCYSIIQRRNGVEIPTRPIRIQKNFGDMPIMIMSTGCHLHGSTPKELVKLKEEVRHLFGPVLKLSLWSPTTACIICMYDRIPSSLVPISLIFCFVDMNSTMNLEAISWSVVLNDASVCYKFLVETTRLPFSEEPSRTEGQHTQTWESPCDVRATMATKRVSPILCII